MSDANPREAPKAKKKLAATQLIGLGIVLALALVVLIGALTGFGR